MDTTNDNNNNTYNSISYSLTTARLNVENKMVN